jgi:hypothetical protein
MAPFRSLADCGAGAAASIAAVEERRPMAAMVAKRSGLVVLVFMVVRVPLLGVRDALAVLAVGKPEIDLPTQS